MSRPPTGTCLVVACPSAGSRDQDELRGIYGIAIAQTPFVVVVSRPDGDRQHAMVHPLDANGEAWLMRYAGRSGFEEDLFRERAGDGAVRIDEGIRDDLYGQVVRAVFGAAALAQFEAGGGRIEAAEGGIRQESPAWLAQEPPTAFRLVREG